MTPQPKVSILICTYNRSELLKKSISSVLTQDFPSNQYEIVVVDNNSNDETHNIVNELSAASEVDVKYVFEKRQGLSYARNLGIEHASGQIIAFIDDDALPDKDWLKEIFRTFEDANPMPGCVGGKVLPVWELVRPGWLPDSLLTYFSIVDLGESPRWLKDNEFIFGTNMAFSRRSLEKAAFFTTRLGRNGRTLISGEETLLFHKLRTIGENIYYQPKAVVKHLIPDKRAQKWWLCKRAFAQGISDYKFNKLTSQTISEKYNNVDFLNIMKKILKALLDIAGGRIQQRFDSLCYLMTISGYIFGILDDKMSNVKNAIKSE